jgi:hypothetical protein
MFDLIKLIENEKDTKIRGRGNGHPAAPVEGSGTNVTSSRSVQEICETKLLT